MKRGLLLAFLAFLMALSADAQITSVGLIGTATPGGWDADTNMVQDPDSAYLWSMTIELVAGVAKFRADDDWATNWGADTFPIGIGTQDGPDIPIPFGGEYYITFNSNTGAYYFSAVSSVGLIGSATPFGWDADINMSQDTGNPNLFWTELNLVAGEAKFRLDDDWAVNWGSTDFPSGTGTQDGPNIPVSQTANYTVSLDTSTGDYFFRANVAYTSLGIIGDGTPGGWDTETAMSATADPNVWNLSMRLDGGGLQFSGNNGEMIWGASDFPSGVAEAFGDTLQVPPGLWVITFNTKTGDYSFEEVLIFQTIGIIGDATDGGWDSDTDMERSPTDSSVWTLRATLLDGEAKFRAENDWVYNWGAGDWPTGTATLDGANIPVTAGEYNIEFNSFTGFYRFQELLVYDTMGLIGTATPFGDWDNDVYMDKDPDDENMWTISEVALLDGEAKFRANSAWDVNWGAADFPTGTGTQDGPNIMIAAGTYGVMLNSASGEYAFGDPISAVEELLRPTDVLAYPNPTTGLLNIDLSNVDMRGTLTLKVFNMNGQLVVSQDKMADSLVQLDVSSLPTGSYTLQIANGKYLVGKRFVVTNK